mmetsp:Transcript_14112/g.26438  ORF Transcript_14112/g.26438 Transcript_14112/m.26438 type:complete len:490 (+) Transcript_14112:28-1497(+)
MERSRILTCAVLCKTEADATKNLIELTPDSPSDELGIVFRAVHAASGILRDIDILLINARKGNDFEDYDLGPNAFLPFKYVRGPQLASIAISSQFGCAIIEREALTAEDIYDIATADRSILRTCLQEWYRSFPEFIMTALETASRDPCACRAEFESLFGYLMHVRYEELEDWVLTYPYTKKTQLYNFLIAFARFKPYYKRLLILIGNWRKPESEFAECRYLVYNSQVESSDVHTRLKVRTARSKDLSATLRFKARPDCDLQEAQRLLEYQIRKVAGFSCSVHEIFNVIFDAMLIKFTREEDIISARFSFSLKDKEFARRFADLEDYLVFCNVSNLPQSISLEADFDVDLLKLPREELQLYEPFLESFRVFLHAVVWKGNAGLLHYLKQNYTSLSQFLIDSNVEAEVTYNELAEFQQDIIRKFIAWPMWREFTSLPIFAKINKKVNVFKSFAKTLNDFFIGEVSFECSLKYLEVELSVVAHGLGAISPFI